MGAACGKGSPEQPGQVVKASSSKRHSDRVSAPPPRTAGDLGTTGHSHLIVKHAGNVRDVYELDDAKIGEGAFGTVCLGKHKATGAVRAIKSVARGSQKNYELLTKEIAAMKAMDHPHIIQLFETFEDRKCIYFAMELCSGGELFDRISQQHHFSEKHAAILMRQILQSINYLHCRHIAHRDLKPENFLFQSKDPLDSNVLKLIDFGLSCPSPPGKVLKTKLGTIYYMAPQILMGRYNLMCDIWSIGVIMHILLSGSPPFHGRSDQETFAKIREGMLSLHGNPWGQISDDAKDLLKLLLKYNPQNRATADDALKHDWILHLAPNVSDKPLDSSVVNRLRAFKTQNHLKKVALQLVATQLNEGEIQALREAFQSLDVNDDGKLTIAELTSGLEKAGLDLSGSDVKQIVANMDGDHSGSIDYTEFLAATLDRKSVLTEDVLWTAFNVFDRNGDGKLSPEELKACLSGPDVSKVVSGARTHEVLKDVDRDGDGFIDFQEFVVLLRATTGQLASREVSLDAAAGGGA